MMSLKSKYSFLERINVNAVYNYFLGLPPQQQTMSLIGAVVGLVIIILLPISLASGKIGRMESSFNKSKQEMGNIVYEIDDYNQMKSKLASFEDSLKTGYDSTLATTIENLAEKSGMQDNIDSIKERPIVSTELFDESIVAVDRLTGKIQRPVCGLSGKCNCIIDGVTSHIERP